MQTPRRALVVSIHDVSPLTSKLVFAMIRDVAAAGVDHIALLVIPNHHSKAPIRENPEFCDWLRISAQMHEVVLHGYFHSRPQSAGGWWVTFVTEHYTAQEGEFYDLSESEARLRLERGKREFAEVGLVPRGFIAPAWLLGREAERAVRGVGFRVHNKAPHLQGSGDWSRDNFPQPCVECAQCLAKGSEPLLEWVAGAQTLRCTTFAHRVASGGLAARRGSKTSPPSGAQRACRSRSNHL